MQFVAIDNSGALSHYGVLGMKWGVRNAETLRKYAGGNNSKPTKRELKKHIKTTKRAYRKETGTWQTTGKNVASLDEKRQKAKENDKELQEHSAKRDYAEKAMAIEERKIQDTSLRKDHLTRLQNDPEATTAVRRAAEEAYLRSKEKSKNSSAKIEKLQALYDEADSGYDRRIREISASYREKYEDAVVKDLGFENIEAGKALLNEYGLMDKALNWKFTRSA